MPEAVAITVSLTRADWDPQMRAWRCPALLWPSVEVGDLYADGKINSDYYSADSKSGHLRWTAEAIVPPTFAKLTLNTKEPLEPQELSLRWKRAAIWGPITSALLVGVLTFLGTHSPPPVRDVTAAKAGEEEVLYVATVIGFDHNSPTAKPARYSYSIALRRQLEAIAGSMELKQIDLVPVARGSDLYRAYKVSGFTRNNFMSISYGSTTNELGAGTFTMQHSGDSSALLGTWTGVECKINQMILLTCPVVFYKNNGALTPQLESYLNATPCAEHSADSIGAIASSCH